MEATVLLLPPLFNHLKLSERNTIFLYLNEISNASQLFSQLASADKKNICNFAESINQRDFSDETLELVKEKLRKLKRELAANSQELDDVKIVFVNYPINSKQFDGLEETLQSLNIKIGKMIISKLPSFDTLLSAKSKYFLCPICFKSYDRDSNFTNEQYTCPLDNESFTISQINKFIDFFTEYYLQNSLEVIQKFVGDERGEKDRKRRMFPLDISNDESLEDNLRRDILSILRKN